MLVITHRKLCYLSCMDTLFCSLLTTSHRRIIEPGKSRHHTLKERQAWQLL